MFWDAEHKFTEVNEKRDTRSVYFANCARQHTVLHKLNNKTNNEKHCEGRPEKQSSFKLFYIFFSFLTVYADFVSN